MCYGIQPDKGADKGADEGNFRWWRDEKKKRRISWSTFWHLCLSCLFTIILVGFYIYIASWKLPSKTALSGEEIQCIGITLA